MRITERMLVRVLDLEKEEDVEGRPFFRFGDGNFYWISEDTYYFREDEVEDVIGGVYAPSIITDWQKWKQLFMFPPV